MTSANQNFGENTSTHESAFTSLISLPTPRFDSDTSVEEALLNRRSIRTFSEQSISLTELSQLLWAAYGITQRIEAPKFLRGGLRTAPSAGALYPLEHYVVTNRIDDLVPGIYRYISSNHALSPLFKGEFIDQLFKSSYGQSMIKDCAVAIVISADYERTVQKYGSRGRDRYVCMDAGHSAENIYLQAYALDLGLTVCGAFDDDELRKVIRLPDQETPLYIIPIGHPVRKDD